MTALYSLWHRWLQVRTSVKCVHTGAYAAFAAWHACWSLFVASQDFTQLCLVCIRVQETIHQARWLAGLGNSGHIGCSYCGGRYCFIGDASWV